MKFSSFLIVILVLCVFIAVQGWIVSQKFLLPKRLEAAQAVIVGSTVEVGTPVSGLVTEVGVAEDQQVSQGQTLFAIVPQSPSDPQGGAPVLIAAQRKGVITDMVVTAGAYVRTSDKLARIVDNSIDAITIEASFPIDPADLGRVSATVPAIVRAPYINSNRPLAAVVSSVDPEYDAKTGTIDVRLRLLEFPEADMQLTVGAPVQVTIDIENVNAVRTFVQKLSNDSRLQGLVDWIARMPIPFSNAQE